MEDESFKMERKDLCTVGVMETLDKEISGLNEKMGELEKTFNYKVLCKIPWVRICEKYPGVVE